MINIRYKLINTKQIVEEFVDEKVSNDEIIVRPKYLSICRADQRYYQGTRDKKILNEKLPLTLIHEAIGEIVFSKDKNFKVGSNVVLLPNIKTETNNSELKENYNNKNKFRGSSCDGFMQNNVVCKKQNVLLLESDDISYVLLELMSVAFNAIEIFEQNKKNINSSIAVYGDGSLGYVTSLILKYLYPKTKIIMIGKNSNKLDFFNFVDEKYTLDKLPNNLSYDHVFECVGGIGSEIALSQIIDNINPQGIINMMGVSEYSVPINTRKVLEKGLILIGNSRSSYEDFKKSIDLIKKYPEISNYLNNIISDIVDVKTISDMNYAFMVDMNNQFKTVMKWDV